MNLTELCACIPKVVVKDDEAVQILIASMEASSKVYKTAVMHLGDADGQQELIKKAIKEKIAPFNVKDIVWKGVYGKPPKIVEYWFFMHGILVIRGIDDTWSIQCAKIPNRKWEKLQNT